jgi:hypothetical protein
VAGKTLGRHRGIRGDEIIYIIIEMKIDLVNDARYSTVLSFIPKVR